MENNWMKRPAANKTPDRLMTINRHVIVKHKGLQNMIYEGFCVGISSYVTRPYHQFFPI